MLIFSQVVITRKRQSDALPSQYQVTVKQDTYLLLKLSYQKVNLAYISHFMQIF